MTSLLGNFLRRTRAGATSLAAVAVTIMTLGATGLVIDHVWLVDQRDTLKSASDAATLAATLAMRREMATDPDIGADTLKEELEAVARRYILMNLQHLPRARYDTMLESLVVEVRPNKGLGTVDVDAQANLGGSIFAAMFASGGSASSGMMNAASRVESRILPVEVVIAIDTSQSMRLAIGGGTAPPGALSRMDIVKRAAKDLVAILNPNDQNRKAVGLVPWNALVQLDEVRAANWVEKGWAKYPRSRRYAHSYFCTPSSTCVSGDEVHTLPSLDDINEGIANRSWWYWWGCLDEHRVSSAGQADLTAVSELFDHPSTKAFAQAFFPTEDGFAYECLTSKPSNYHSQGCYGDNSANLLGIWPTGDYQRDCVPTHPILNNTIPAILPLTSARDEIEAAIDSLQPVGQKTHSALGVLWGQRLLSHSWNAVWGNGTHPVDPAAAANAGTRKAIVLLTDGHDSVARVGIERETACAAAKGQGTEIFVVAPLASEDIASSLGTSLTACSSKADHPEGSYVFLDNPDEASLRAAFASIASQLVEMRRVY